MTRTDAVDLLEGLEGPPMLKGRLRAIAASTGKNHDLATRLWASGVFNARMVSLLIVDLKAVDLDYLDLMLSHIDQADAKEQSELCDWLIASVIMKKAPLKKEAAKWRTDPSILRQRIFWSVQARSVRPQNADLNQELLAHIERDLASAAGPIQWNMNWCAAQIGIADAGLRGRCVALGERLGLYRDYPVAKGCTSPYLPIWIGSVVGKSGGG